MILRLLGLTKLLPSLDIDNINLMSSAVSDPFAYTI